MSPIRVVLADDHPWFREALQFTLERAGDIAVVAEAADGLEAVERVLDEAPDVVVMDLAMPRLGGVDAITRLAQHGSTARILVLTLSEDDASLLAALQAGASGYLVKGAGPDHVVMAVRGVAAGQAVFGPGFAARLLALFGGPARPGRFAELSEREREVLEHVAQGLTNHDIADRLRISPITVRNHVSNILTKLQVKNRREAMLRFHDR